MSETELTEAVLTVIRENPEAVIKALATKFDKAVMNTINEKIKGASLVELLATPLTSQSS